MQQGRLSWISLKEVVMVTPQTAPEMTGAEARAVEVETGRRAPGRELAQIRWLRRTTRHAGGPSAEDDGRRRRSRAGGIGSIDGKWCLGALVALTTYVTVVREMSEAAKLTDVIIRGVRKMATWIAHAAAPSEKAVIGTGGPVAVLISRVVGAPNAGPRDPVADNFDLM